MAEFWEKDLAVIFTDQIAAFDGMWNGRPARIMFSDAFRSIDLSKDDDLGPEPIEIMVRASEITPKHGDTVVIFGRKYFAGYSSDSKRGLVSVQLWREKR